DMLKRLADLFDREREMENRITLAGNDENRVKFLISIPRINVYSAAVIILRPNTIGVRRLVNYPYLTFIWIGLQSS
ncbi:MAG: hypothetical protein ACP5OC_09015, partial [Thermoplasmata archaeon]